jgi:hypothetical protein
MKETFAPTYASERLTRRYEIAQREAGINKKVYKIFMSEQYNTAQERGVNEWAKFHLETQQGWYGYFYT